MAIASGTCGTCTWTISDDGVLTVRPTSGSSGNLDLGARFIVGKGSWPWNSYRSQIIRIVLSGNITTSHSFAALTSTGDYSSIFKDCVNLVSISGIASLKGAINCSSMFEGCTSIEELNLSSFDASAARYMNFMFSGCTSLSNVVLTGINTSNVTSFTRFLNGCESLASVDLSSLNTTSADMSSFFYNTPLLSHITLGAQFYVPPVSTNGYKWKTYFHGGKNITNGIVVDSDESFSGLTNADRAGTWERGVSYAYRVTAARVNAGVADEDGEDVAITARWATQAETTERTLTIYQKPAGDSTYPSTPVSVQTLSGNSGVTTVTVTDVGDDAYDFRVEFYDGTNTYVAFPSVQSNIRLITIDSTGNVCLYLDTTASSGEVDAELYEAITALGWQDRVLV